ncbi:MAG TPA: tetratricopeptide repeat protein, partial [Xanthobacteraceae bacterium]
EEALEHIRYAMRLSPRDPVMAYWLGFAGAAELELKRSNRAIEYLERALVLNPEQPRTLLTFAAALALAGRPDEARAKFEQVQKALPHITGEKLLERLFGSNAGAPQSQLAEGLRRVVAAGRSWESPLPKRTDAPALRRDIIPVAILPFKTYESSEQVRLLADMMTDDLINMLSRVPSFRVISRQTSRSYAQPVDIAAIGTELGVRYILEGTMRVQGDRLRVNVELIDPATRLPVWSDRIEREGADRHAVQDEIVARLARELQFELYPVESERRSQDADADAVAYRGWAAMSAAYARSGMDAFNKAEALFRQALERDPQHFSARLGIAAFHANVGAQVLDDHSRAHLDTAVELLRQLVAQDPNSSSAHHFLGLADGARGNLPEAVAAFTRAVELNPSAAGSHAHLGHRWAMTGKPAEGLEYLRYAMRLSPRDPNMAYWLEFAGCAELELHRYAEAIETFRRSIALNPGYPRSLVGMIAAQTLSGNVEGARPYINKLKTLVPSLTPQQMFARFGRKPGLAPQLREGLRIALTPPA